MFARLARRSAVVLGLLLSVYSGVGVQQTQGRVSALSCAGRHDVAFSTAADPATQRAVAAVACATSVVRDLAPRSPVMVRLEDAAGMRTQIQQLLQHDDGYRVLQQTSAALQLLGAMNSGDNIAAISNGKYNTTAVAEYSPYDKTLHVRSVNGKFTPLDLAIVAHEYERALQDQYFNLSALLADTGGSTHNSDARLAREAVAEGDAFTTMLNYAASTFSRQQTLQFNQQLQKIPTPSNTDFVQDLVGFPASQGTTFVGALRTAASSKKAAAAKQAAANNAVDQALRNPPGSTAQVLNPALYTNHDSTPQTAPATLPGMDNTWSAGASDVMGAFGIGDLLQRYVPAKSPSALAAQQAATAWQGDRWVLYQHNKDSLLVWRLHFSTAAAAQSFVQAFAGFTGGRFHATIAVKPRLDWETTGFAVGARVRSSDVAVAIGSDKSLLSTCDQALVELGFS